MQSQPSWSSRGDKLSKAYGEEGKKKGRGTMEESSLYKWSISAIMLSLHIIKTLK
jgi:hypothetical protein